MAISRSISLPKELHNMVRGLTNQFTKMARSLAPNSHIRRIIKTRSLKDGSSVSLVVSASGPDARAYEKGSGIHSTGKRKSKHQETVRGPIIIKPTTKKALAFPWEIASSNPESFTMLPDGRVVLPSVKHPGVEAANNGKGYLKPASQKMRGIIRKSLRAAVKRSLITDMRAMGKDDKSK